MVMVGSLFLNKSMEWPEFQRAVLNGHKSRQGPDQYEKEAEVAIPDCTCQS